MNRIMWFLFLVISLSIGAQAKGRIQGYASKVGVKLAPVAAGPISPRPIEAYPYCTVSIYVGGTKTLSRIYADDVGKPKANPFTADSNGFWSFYADNGRYDLEFSGAGIATPFTLQDYFLTGVAPTPSPQCGVTQFGCGTNSTDAPCCVAPAIVFQVADSSSASSLNSTSPVTLFQTWRSAAGATPVIAYPFELTKTGGQGDSFGVFSTLWYTANMAGFTASTVYHNALRSEILMSPTNVGSGSAVGYAGWFRGLKYSSGNVRAVGAQIDASNYGGSDADTDASTVDSTIALAINTDTGKHNSVGIYMQAASNATAYSLGLRVTRNSLYRYVLDIKDAFFDLQGTVSVTNGSPTVSGSSTFFTKEIVPEDQLFIYGIPYTVASVSSDTSLTLANNHVGTGSGLSVFKSVVPLRVSNAGYLVSRNNATTADLKMIGVDVSDRLNIRNSTAILFQNDRGTAEFGRWSSSGLQITGVTFSSLGSPSDGTIVYCPDCKIQSSCAGSGSGAFAKRIAGAWICN